MELPNSSVCSWVKVGCSVHTASCAMQNLSRSSRASLHPFPQALSLYCGFSAVFFTPALFSVCLLKTSNTHLFWQHRWTSFSSGSLVKTWISAWFFPSSAQHWFIQNAVFCCSQLGFKTQICSFSELLIFKKCVTNALQVIVPFVLVAGGSLFPNQPLNPSYYSIILSCRSFFFPSFACAASHFLNN